MRTHHAQRVRGVITVIYTDADQLTIADLRQVSGINVNLNLTGVLGRAQGQIRRGKGGWVGVPPKKKN